MSVKVYGKEFLRGVSTDSKSRLFGSRRIPKPKLGNTKVGPERGTGLVPEFNRDRYDAHKRVIFENLLGSYGRINK